ncbi:MAG: DUF4339 domain-containing protein [Verrucomicrobia bacterium]|nr:DUF4339 domain-containing protein [Verrucomicrobiota bacterium]
MSTILVLKDGEKWGPYTTEELEVHVEEGTFTPEDLVWWEGLEEWQPLSSLFEEEEPPDFECDGVRVFSDRVEVDGVSLLAPLILRASVQKQKVRRARPIIGAIIVGVLAVCVALVPIPKQNHTEWIVWGIVLLGLLIWCVRLMYAGLGGGRSLLIVDLADGNERIRQVDPALAPKLEEALGRVIVPGRHIIPGN